MYTYLFRWIRQDVERTITKHWAALIKHIKSFHMIINYFLSCRTTNFFKSTSMRTAIFCNSPFSRPIKSPRIISLYFQRVGHKLTQWQMVWSSIYRNYHVHLKKFWICRRFLNLYCRENDPFFDVWKMWIKWSAAWPWRRGGRLQGGGLLKQTSRTMASESEEQYGERESAGAREWRSLVKLHLTQNIPLPDIWQGHCDSIPSP